MSWKRSVSVRRTWWVLLLGILLSAAISILFLIFLRQQEKMNIERIRTIYAERTENLINSMFHKTDVLAAAVKMENGDVSEETFNMLARLVYQKDSGIRGIQYMPGAIVTYSYPVEGNEGVMGKNFLEIPERRKDVMLAIDTKSIALSGPYNLIQGGLGVVARNPIFLQDAAGKEYFWGFSAIILNLPDALTSAGLGRLSEEGYDFQLFCINENKERLVIAGNASLDVSGAECGTIEVPHHEWTLAITSLHPWQKFAEALFVFGICFLLTAVLWKLAYAVMKEKDAVQAKDRFFSDISHDMRTPLNAVLGFTALAQAAGTTEKQKEDYLAKIESSGKLLLELVNDMLTISRANDGKIRLHPEPCLTEEIGRTVLSPTAELAEQKGIHLEVDTSGFRGRTILADRLNVEKIFLNLITNAVRYTPAGGHVYLMVRDEPADAKEPDILFLIRDDGIGMSREFLAHIYEPFAQEKKPGYESGGTGLGLAIVKQLVDLMGGTIRIESEEGKGTEVTVRLHFPEAAAESQEREKRLPAPEDGSLAGKKILLCEDNVLNQEIAVALLKNKGMDVLVAANGEEGLKVFAESAENEFSAILMDVRMPVMDGITAVRMIRALDRADAGTVPVIAMTADAFDEDVKRCLASGMNGYISKPVDPEKMFRALLRAVSVRN